MSVGLLIITHNLIGAELLDAAHTMMGHDPLIAHTLAVDPDDAPDELDAQAEALRNQLDQGEGVLVLTDAYGSTPSNVANRLKARGRVRVVSGVNLPMVVRVLNYAALDLDALADKARSGGRDGIIVCDEQE